MESYDEDDVKLGRVVRKSVKLNPETVKPFELDYEADPKIGLKTKIWSQLPIKCSICQEGRARVKGKCMSCYDRMRVKKKDQKILENLDGKTR